jgi:predicted Zn-dependent protease
MTQKNSFNSPFFEPIDNEIMNKAMLLRSEGKRIEAINILTPLNKEYKNNSVFNGIMGMNYRELNNNEKSLYYFKKTTILSPNKELPSVSLFNILCEMGRFKAAFNEMDRFLSGNLPNHYKITLDEQMKQLTNETPKYQRDILEKYNPPSGSSL